MENLYLFDFDGVLVDSLSFYEQAVNRCLAELGAPPLESRQEYLDIFEDNFYEGIRKRGVDVEAFMAVSRALAPELDCTLVQPVAGLAPVLGALAAVHDLLVISSNSAAVIRSLLARFDLERYFADVLGLEFTLSKVDKIRHAMTRFASGPGETFYIGDTAGDIREAREAGVRAVAVTWGWHTREKLALAAPDVIVDVPAELLAVASS
jgi:phosphoglycolate phosphatase